MFEWPQLTLFLGAAVILLLTPGPAVMYIIARSVDQGRPAGVVASAGMGVGTMFHVLAAALGISALLVSSALAFAVVKYLGAFYLIYLGVRQFLAQPGPAGEPANASHKSLPRIFRESVLVNVLNPKTALFFFAFLPQFARPEQGSVALQLLLLGGLFVVMGLVSDSLYALLAGTAGQLLRRNLRFLRAQRYFAGTVYIALGLATAFTGADQE